ncbi:MAG TPA: LPXTG cell wall anchor domain-containing protein [archaeon]|nr:LPXTG cell wall anchor domain-containing protein [archaeon]
MIISSQYNYDFFSVFIIIIYSLFYPTLTNLLFVLLFMIIVFIKTGEIAITWWYLMGIMSAIIVIASIFGSKKQEEEDSGGYDDLLRMLGKQ